MVSSRFFNRLFPATMRDRRGPKPLFRRRKLATLPSLNDNGGAQHFAEYVSPTMRTNPLTGVPGGLFPLRVKRTVAVSTGGGTTTVRLEADKGEIWMIHHGVGIHNDVANRIVTISYEPKLPSAILLPLASETVVKNVSTTLFPVFHDKSNDHDHVICFHMMRVQREVADFIVSVTALGLNKTVFVDWLYERVK